MMSENNKNKDVFLEYIGKVQPLKKNIKNFKKVNLLTNKKLKSSKKENVSGELKNTVEEKTIIKKNNLRIEKSLIEKKFKKGKVFIDKKVDFHGLSVEKAKNNFFKTVDECFYSNKRCILFITGKGMQKTTNDTTTTKLFYGKIRENFQKWIYEKDVSLKILNVMPAGFLHGGDGAFFVYLRKNKN